ncbi:hypothetical protein [Caulobacter sp. X]|jgi:hypothetical protein|uniref:hypothetical protein n=1 Tax=Caulobacter sp. X TaxID=2048901 RepID=UPI000C15C88B|nr:hypothetical protein [Caulobacter sp. X]PIB95310.1 hypothetical protein CSW60_22460 [Caulobacter sp. X]
MNVVMRRFCATGAAAGLVLALQSREAPFVGSLGVAAVLMSLLLFGLVTLAAHQARIHLALTTARKANAPRHKNSGDTGECRR